MAEETTKVNISLGDCVLEFSGSEAFVQKQIDEFKGLIHGKLKPVKAGKPKDKPHRGQQDKVDYTTQDSPFAAYPNVIEYDEETINILKVDGTKKTDKTRNLALMYAWAKKQLGIDDAPKEELAELCKHHECFDEANFKTTLKGTSGIVIKGTAKNYTIRLTAPGKKKAEKILKALNEQES